MLIREQDKGMLTDLINLSIDEPVEVWAYGSRVNGIAHDASDIDLVVRTASLRPIRAESLLRLKDRITNSNIPVLVEIRDWALLPYAFHKVIEGRHEVFLSTLGKT